MQWSPIIVLSMTGCYAPTVPAGGACSTACPGDLVCVAGTCRSPGDPGPDGSPDVDTDGDGRSDDRDNCIARANADQHDEDADGAGDACDPCPHLAGAGTAAFADGDGDGVGDACDPEPTRAAQAWVFFDTFAGPKRPEWGGADGATFGNDRLALASDYLRLNIANGELRIAVGGSLGNFGALPRQHVIELAEQTGGAYYYAESYQETSGAFVRVTKFDGTDYVPASPGQSLASGIPAGAFTWVIDESVTAQTFAITPQHAGVAYPRLQGTTTAPRLEATGWLVFGAQRMTVTYDYVAIIRTTP